MADCAECRELLHQILELLHPKKCTASDRDALGVLLPAIAGRFGSAPTRTKELLADPGIRGVVNGSAGAIGGLLSRACDDGLVISGLQVRRAAREGNAVLWIIDRALPEAMAKAEKTRSNGSRRKDL
jgi:hypothetical protein